MIKKDLWTKLAFHRKSCKVFAHIILFSTQFKNKTVFLLSHLRNRQTISFLEYSHIRKFRKRSNGYEWYDIGKFLNESHNPTYPPWILTWGFWIIVIRHRVKLSLISMRLSNNLRNTNYSWKRTIGVIKKYHISYTHVISHKISSLVISHTKPTWDIISLKIINRIFTRLWFHQPISHNQIIIIKSSFQETSHLQMRKISSSLLLPFHRDSELFLDQQMQRQA